MMNNTITKIKTTLKNRPIPIWQFDQVHMFENDCLLHAKEILPTIRNKKLIFIGDSDCISLTLLLLLEEGSKFLPKQITVLDFDLRLLQFIEDTASKINHGIKLDTVLHNLKYPIHNSTKEKYDFFHINPPFGSQNGGYSLKFWLYRAIDSCKEKCDGCIIMGNPSQYNWAKIAYDNLLLELKRLNFADRITMEIKHKYYSYWDLSLTSQSILVSSAKKIISPIHSSEFSNKEMLNIYGDTLELPEYITEEKKLGY